MQFSIAGALSKVQSRWGEPSHQRNLSVLFLTLFLGALCGIVQVMTLNAIPTLLPLGILLAGAYLLLALSRSLAALVLFVIVFVEFWGLVPEAQEFGDVKLIDIVTAMVVIPLIVHLIRMGFPFRGTPARRMRLVAILLLVLIGGEILLTTLRTDQSFWLSTKAAKPYLYYLSFLMVPIYADGSQRVRRLAAWLTAIATGLALLYLLVSLVGEIRLLPGLIVGETGFIGLGTFTRVRSNGAPLIVAMLLYQLYRYADGRASLVEKISLIFLFLGALVHFYRSLWVGILVGILVQAGIEGRHGARTITKFLMVLVALSIGIGVIHPEYGGMIVSRAASTVTEMEEMNGSYGIRQEQIQRWTPILRENWVAGIGFLHHDSAIGQQMEALYELEGTGNYDVGWVDLLGRLGVIGVILLLLSLFLFTSGGWRASSYQSGGDVAVYRRTILAYIVVGIVSLPGYPLLSWSAGILPLALLVGMLATAEWQGEADPGACNMPIRAKVSVERG